MKPIRVKLVVSRMVDVDDQDPEYFEVDGMIPRKSIDVEMNGVLLGFIVLNDSEPVQYEDFNFTDGERKPYIKKDIVSNSNVYLNFWEDKGDYYSLVMERYIHGKTQILLTKSEMHNYVSHYYKG